MPELPDVEVFRRYLESTSLHQEIENVRVLSKSILEGVSVRKLKEALAGSRFNAGRRHGKQLFAELDNGLWLGLHFGMTGYLKYFKNKEKRPDYERMVIDFADGYHLSYVCARKLGKIRLIEDLKTFIEDKNLGWDVLDEALNQKAFGKLLEGTRATVKSALMNQGLMAGIGNVYSDEILFQSGIYPKKKASRLDENQTKVLHENVRKVLGTAIASGADPDRLPDSYLIPHREKNGKCPRCGKGLHGIKVSGRSGYYCEHCQPED